MVYLIHFDRPYRHAGHYIGWTHGKRTLTPRLEHHRNGRGARLLAVVAAAGIGFPVVRTWPDGDRTLERRLKNRKKARCLRPACRVERSKTKGGRA